MNIPNRPMSGFEKFNIKTTSASSINEFVSYRSKFVLRKIFNYNFASNPAMERGNVSELGAQMILESTATEEEAIDFALQKFDEKCTPDMKDYQSERLTIPHLIKGAVHEIKNHIGDLYSYQAKVEGVLHEYKFTGYTDFVLENKSTGEKIIVDLKTTKRTPSSLSPAHARQISLYSHALQCDAKLLYLVPHRKTDRKTKEVTYTTEGIWWELEDKQKHLDDCHEILKAMDMLLYNCNDRHEVAKMCYPDVSEWYWNTPDIIKARKKVWGV